jgi:tetratricopeptide (TPR) repeat protein
MTRIKWIEKYLTEAEQLIYNDQVEQALKILNNLLHQEPGYGRLHNHLGWAYLYYSDEVRLAELHLKMAIQFDESYAAPYLHLGSLYIREERFSEALTYLQHGLSKPKSNRVALLQSLGCVHELRGEWRKAIAAYKKAMLASIQEHEVTDLEAGIKRCLRKRVALFFSRA